MPCDFVSGLQTVTHKSDVLTNFKCFSKDRLSIFSGIPGITINDKQNTNSDIINRRYPLEGVVQSPAILINAETLPTQDPSNFVVFSGNSLGNIEFRLADNRDMSGASEWESYNTDSFSSQNYSFFDIKNDFGGPYSTLPEVLISEEVTSGIRMTATDANAVGEASYFTRGGFHSGVQMPSTTTADYLSVNVNCSKSGPVLEWIVLNGLLYDKTNKDILSVKEPFKHLIYIDEANKDQEVFWDITDWPLEKRSEDYIRGFGFKVLDGSGGNLTATFTQPRFFNLNAGGGGIPSGLDFPASHPCPKYIQYRVVMSETTKDGESPEFSQVSFQYNVRKTLIPNSLLRHNKCIDDGSVDYASHSGLCLVYK